MNLLDMYKGVPNSPITTIVDYVNNTDTVIIVVDPTVIPDAPNILVLGGDTENPETVKLISREANTLTVERGLQGAAQNWDVGTKISRNFTEHDYNTLIENIKRLDTNAAEHEYKTMPHIIVNHQTDKTYRYGYQISLEGKPQIIYEEVI